MSHLHMRKCTLPLVFVSAAVLSMCASAFHLQAATEFVPGLGLRGHACASGAGVSCGLRASSVRVRSSRRVTMDLKMSEEETKTGDQYFTTAVSLQGEGKSEDALKVLDQAEAAWKSQGKLDGDTPYAKALLEMREKLQSASQKEEDPVQIALLKSVKEASASADEALKKKEVKSARASYDEATNLYESDSELDDKDTSIMLRELGQRVKFAEWKEQAEANTERSEAEWAEREAMKRARKDKVAAEVKTLERGDETMKMRTSAKDQADTAFSLAEQLLAEGDLAGARAQLEVAEVGWGAAGMLGFPGKPFEAAIEGVLEKIAEKEASA